MWGFDMRATARCPFPGATGFIAPIGMLCENTLCENTLCENTLIVSISTAHVKRSWAGHVIAFRLRSKVLGPLFFPALMESMQLAIAQPPTAQPPAEPSSWTEPPGMGSLANVGGNKIDGLGENAHLEGESSVIGTLWDENDASTAL